MLRNLKIFRSWMLAASCACIVALATMLTPAIHAQKADPGRKVLHKVAPVYPMDLKRNGIGGVVRLSLEISPRGTVEKVKPIGGNAALVDAATLAVKEWKYEPADSTTTVDVQFDFVPGQQ